MAELEERVNQINNLLGIKNLTFFLRFDDLILVDIYNIPLPCYIPNIAATAKTRSSKVKRSRRKKKEEKKKKEI